LRAIWTGTRRAGDAADLLRLTDGTLSISQLLGGDEPQSDVHRHVAQPIERLLYRLPDDTRAGDQGSRRVVILPRGVRLTTYGGGAADLPAAVLQDFPEAVGTGQAVIPIDRTFDMSEIQVAHAYMESGRARGKLVVTT
jgi:NADPH:quinone reductase-like Zn-dependent oxidoreductase